MRREEGDDWDGARECVCVCARVHVSDFGGVSFA